jgi:hypothetical protein
MVGFKSQISMLKFPRSTEASVGRQQQLGFAHENAKKMPGWHMNCFNFARR